MKKPYRPATSWEVRRCDWVNKKPPKSLLRRWPEQLVREAFLPGATYRGPWPYVPLERATRRSSSYDTSYFSIRDILRVINKTHKIECLVCRKPFKLWTDEAREAFNKKLHAHQREHERWLKRWSHAFGPPQEPKPLCCIGCERRERYRRETYRRAANLRKMYEEMASEMYWELVEQAREMVHESNEKFRQVRAMIRASTKFLKDREEEERESNTEREQSGSKLEGDFEYPVASCTDEEENQDSGRPDGPDGRHGPESQSG